MIKHPKDLLGKLFLKQPFNDSNKTNYAISFNEFEKRPDLFSIEWGFSVARDILYM